MSSVELYKHEKLEILGEPTDKALVTLDTATQVAIPQGLFFQYQTTAQLEEHSEARLHLTENVASRIGDSTWETNEMHAFL